MSFPRTYVKVEIVLPVAVSGSGSAVRFDAAGFCCASPGRECKITTRLHSRTQVRIWSRDPLLATRRSSVCFVRFTTHPRECPYDWGHCDCLVVFEASKFVWPNAWKEKAQLTTQKALQIQVV